MASVALRIALILVLVAGGNAATQSQLPQVPLVIRDFTLQFNPTGNQASAQFLLLTAYSTSYTPRKAQLGVRLEF